MSTGGIFTILTNDGKQDRLLMAQSFLNKRLLEIERTRRNVGLDPTPTLADIQQTHNMFLVSQFKPFVSIGYEYNITPPESGTARFGGTVQFSIPQFGDFFHDMAIHVVLENLQPKNSAQYPPDPPGAPDNEFIPQVQDQVRYCEYPGERLLQQVRFEVNHNPLDSYGPGDVVMHRLFTVRPHKLRAWERCVGQQQQHVGSLTHGAGSSNSAEVKYFTNGAQTWKNKHERLEMWIPLLFWFNLDPALSIPSVAIPYGQRYIVVNIANVDQICEARSYRNTSAQLHEPLFARFELVINNIFVNPEIHDIFIKRVGFSMVRVHVNQHTMIDQPHVSALLNKLKWPVEEIRLGLQPAQNQDSLQDWHIYGHVHTHTQLMPICYDVPGANPTGIGFSEATWREITPSIDSLGISAHDVTLYEKLPVSFYNSYIPLARGTDIVSPTDNSVAMIPFNLHPGNVNPSGHVNVSRARELYVHISAPRINTSQYGILSVHAKAINFLLISDGSAVLRYST